MKRILATPMLYLNLKIFQATLAHTPPDLAYRLDRGIGISPRPSVPFVPFINTFRTGCSHVERPWHSMVIPCGPYRRHGALRRFCRALWINKHDTTATLNLFVLARISGTFFALCFVLPHCSLWYIGGAAFPFWVAHYLSLPQYPRESPLDS